MRAFHDPSNVHYPFGVNLGLEIFNYIMVKDVERWSGEHQVPVLWAGDNILFKTQGSQVMFMLSFL